MKNALKTIFKTLELEEGCRDSSTYAYLIDDYPLIMNRNFGPLKENWIGREFYENLVDDFVFGF